MLGFNLNHVSKRGPIPTIKDYFQVSLTKLQVGGNQSDLVYNQVGSFEVQAAHASDLHSHSPAL